MLNVGCVLDSSYKRRIMFTDTVTVGIMNSPACSITRSN